jgi:hypothetical protein
MLCNTDCAGVFSADIKCVSVVCFCDSKVREVYIIVDFTFQCEI